MAAVQGRQCAGESEKQSLRSRDGCGRGGAWAAGGWKRADQEGDVTGRRGRGHMGSVIWGEASRDDAGTDEPGRLFCATRTPTCPMSQCRLSS